MMYLIYTYIYGYINEINISLRAKKKKDLLFDHYAHAPYTQYADSSISGSYPYCFFIYIFFWRKEEFIKNKNQKHQQQLQTLPVQGLCQTRLLTCLQISHTQLVHGLLHNCVLCTINIFSPLILLMLYANLLTKRKLYM